MRKKGEITVYLSLVFILLLSFIAALMESASVQNAKNNRRADVNRGMESVFAEYQKELLEEYDIFALEGSYESGHYSKDQVLERLSFYGAGNMEHRIKRIQFLTDNGCQPFYDQVAAYMRHKYGLTAMEDMLGTSDTWKEQSETAKQYQQEEQDAENQLSEVLEQSEQPLPEEGNALSHTAFLKQQPLLQLVCPKEMQISEKRVEEAELLSNRQKNEGYGDFSDVAQSEEALSKLLLGEYAMEHFNSAADTEQEGALDYELEYILSGRPSDRENLQKMAEKLLLIRFVPNYFYLQTDSEKRAEAEAMALTLSTLVLLPEAAELVTQALLLAWAFGETVVDIRTLLGGRKVPLTKSKESWQLGLSSLLTLGTEQDTVQGMDSEDGLDYNAYIQMLLFLESKEQTGERTLDMIEQSLQKRKGLDFFKADQCISRMEIDTICPLRRGITYQFYTYFGYN